MAHISEAHFQVNCGEFKSEQIFSINANIFTHAYLDTYFVRNYKLTMSTKFYESTNE